jgi:hypothetical protein
VARDRSDVFVEQHTVLGPRLALDGGRRVHRSLVRHRRTRLSRR